MMAPSVTIVQTGVANAASVIAAFRRLGVACDLTTSPHTIAQASHIVLPGVGSFAAAMNTLSMTGADRALRTRILDGRPTLAICLGMQLLCRTSEECIGAAGLGVIESRAIRFSATATTPQLGWNSIIPAENAPLIEQGWAYFANSYRIIEPPEGWSCSFTDHDGPFIAAMAHGAVLACQFHPELSGAWGARLVNRWLSRSGACTKAAPC